MTRTASHDVRLNCVDRLTLVAGQALRRAGFPGFLCQMQVDLAGRFDPTELSALLDPIVAEHPALRSRLVVPSRRSGPHWRPVETPYAIDETTVADEAGAALAAESLLAEPCDLSRDGALRWRIVHLPHGLDRLILQYDHALLDTIGAGLLLKRLARGASAAEPELPVSNPIRTALRRYTRWQRVRAAVVEAVRVVRTQWLRPRSPIRLTAARSGAPGVRIRRLAFDIDATRRIGRGLRRATGVPSWSLGVAAAAFRALVAVEQADARAPLRINLSLDLRPAGDPRALLHNLVSRVPLGCTVGETADPIALIRTLGANLRSALERRRDLGFLQLAAALDRLGPGPASVDRGLRNDPSMNYGYFGELLEGVSNIAGRPVLAARHLILPWSPPGLGLTANLARGALEVVVTTSRAVPEPVAEAFQRRLAGELESLAEGATPVAAAA
jgi:hypothetical protein